MSSGRPLQYPEMTRRRLLATGTAALGLAAGRMAAGAQVAPAPNPLEHGRPAEGQRRFRSKTIEDEIARVTPLIGDREIARIFGQCFPNTLDTTVFTGTVDGKPDTYIITGDIDALWLRDSSAQVWPYLRYAKQDAQLRVMFEGLVRRHARMILRDPYANAFTREVTQPPLSWAVHDRTDMRPGVAERKWEVDSLCYVLRLAHGFWRATGETGVFDETWHKAARLIVATFREQQRRKSPGPYHFERESAHPTDTLPLAGYGNPALPNGLLCSMFRPSDDACIYPYLIPSNLFAIAQLGHLSAMARSILHDEKLAGDADGLRKEVADALLAHGRVRHPVHGEMWAYEVDGFGNVLMMDDANAPGLLSLPYLECCDRRDTVYQNTRRFALSASNPYFFRGEMAEGIGGPHIGLGYIWPMSILLRGLTSDSEDEVRSCLRMLRDTTGGTGFMHEAFQKDHPADFTRPWFSWANSLFGELVLRVMERWPALLTKTL